MTRGPLQSAPRYNGLVNVELTADRCAFVQKAIESGRFTREEEAVEEAEASLVRDRRRIAAEGRHIPEQGMRK